jgi:hypothetical protein
VYFDIETFIYPPFEPYLLVWTLILPGEDPHEKEDFEIELGKNCILSFLNKIYEISEIYSI